MGQVPGASSTALRPNLSFKVDYVVVTHSTWKKFEQWCVCAADRCVYQHVAPGRRA